MELTPELKRRFCKNCNIPISIFVEPFFTDRIKLFSMYYNTIEELQKFVKSIEPYNFQEAVPFQQAYLAGYLADRYDVNVDERIDRARERIRVCTEQAFRKTVRGYNGRTSVKDSNVQIHNASYWYAMYPVWILNTTWKGEKFIFAMNGQTGKMVGDLPIDRSKFWKSVGIRTLLIWGVLYGLKCLFLM